MARVLIAKVFFILFVSFCTSENEDTFANVAPLSRELSASELEYYVNTEEGKEILVNEFHAIKSGQRRPWTVAELPENIEKNRYKDLLAYDATRVTLELLPGDPNSDYINANYIDGQNSEREYVATQGPLPNTVNDFWRMIWQLNATKIVMLANIIEKNETKVEKYWPENKDIYGEITVTKLSEYEIPEIEHVVRTFLILKDGIERPRVLRHFHFTGWPDLGVPKDRLSTVSIIEQARNFCSDNKAPIVVHCSAGVGRTGTMILTDSMIQKVKSEGIVDFPKRLDHMRVQRVDVVEKEEQYIFSHQAVYEYFNAAEADEILKEIDEEYRNVDIQYFSDIVTANVTKYPQLLQEIKECIKNNN